MSAVQNSGHFKKGKDHPNFGKARPEGYGKPSQKKN